MNTLQDFAAAMILISIILAIFLLPVMLLRFIIVGLC